MTRSLYVLVMIVIEQIENYALRTTTSRLSIAYPVLLFLYFIKSFLEMTILISESSSSNLRTMSEFNGPVPLLGEASKLRVSENDDKNKSGDKGKVQVTKKT